MYERIKEDAGRGISEVTDRDRLLSEMSLERAFEFTADELIRVTPKAIRLRKRILKASERPKK